MKLRKATTLSICLGTLALLAIISLATHLIIDTTFDELENAHAVRNLERARNAVQQELTSLDEIIVDWAVWDDSARFMRGKSKAFVESNLNDRTLASLRLAAVVFLDTKGKVLLAQGFDPIKGIKAPLPQGLLERLVPGSSLVAARNVEDRVKGLMLLPQGLMLAASCPIPTATARARPWAPWSCCARSPRGNAPP